MSHRSESPPSYQVYETKDGRLVNRMLQLVWPEKAPGNKKLFDGYVVKQSIDFEHTSVAPDPETTSQTSIARDTRKFIGGSSLSEIKKQLRNNDFLIFYPLPDIQKGDDLSLKLPLLLGYRSSHGKVYYLPIKRERHRWCIQFPNGQRHLKFRTIQSLIEYYQTYGYISQTGEIEIFCLNMLENISTE